MRKKLKPGVSVVVCCYNSSAVIVPTLQALAAQTIPAGMGYEVIVVDNHCTDHTVSLVEAVWRESTFPMFILKEPQPGLIFARKTGVLQAQYQNLLFVDDDNVLAPDWVSRLLEIYAQRPDVGGIGGYIQPLFEEKNGVAGQKPEWFDTFCGMYACTPAKQNPGLSAFKDTLYGAGLSLRTHLARALFDDSLPFFLVGRTADILHRGDDSEICLRVRLMGWKLWYEQSLKMKHIILEKRLYWQYVLDARRGGGFADIILNIYRALLENKTPLDYPHLANDICSRWQVFWQNRAAGSDLSRLSQEGERSAVRHAYYQGLTSGFLKMTQSQYQTIRDQICRFFPTWPSPRFCLHPFTQAQLQANGEVYVCCSSWLKHSLGNIFKSDFKDIWNSETARAIRESIIDGSFRYCNSRVCPLLVSRYVERTPIPEKLKEVVDNKQTRLDIGPENLSLNYDNSCNFHCKSCRGKVKMLDKESAEHLIQFQNSLLTADFFKDVREVVVSGAGEVFASPVFMDFLQNLDLNKYPQLTIILRTNGHLLTPSKWEQIKNAHYAIKNVSVSIDAATAETYGKLREGGDFNRLMVNLKFLKELKERYKFTIKFNFVVQEQNFEEMPAFVELALQFDCDNVAFTQLTNLGTYTPEEYTRLAIHLPTHPQFQKLKSMLGQAIFKEPIITFQNLAHLVTEEK